MQTLQARVSRVSDQNVPPYAIAAGNRGTLVRCRFARKNTERLLKVAWWDWPADRVGGAVPYPLAKDIEAFLSAAENGEI